LAIREKELARIHPQTQFIVLNEQKQIIFI